MSYEWPETPYGRAADYLHGEDCACEQPERREGHVEFYLTRAELTLWHARNGHTKGCGCDGE